MKNEESQKIKIAVIAGAAEALNYKEKHPRESNDKALQHVTKKVREILRKIDKEEYE